jgi:hypothetical protein
MSKDNYRALPAVDLAEVRRRAVEWHNKVKVIDGSPHNNGIDVWNRFMQWYESHLIHQVEYDALEVQYLRFRGLKFDHVEQDETLPAPRWGWLRWLLGR